MNVVRTPLHVAVVEENFEVIFELITIGKANLNAKDPSGNTPLHLAIKTKNFNIVKLLINSGADVNMPNRMGEKTPLHEAATESNNVEILKLLIDAGADVNAEDIVGRLPVHWAAAWGNSNVVRLLIDSGANVNWKDRLKNYVPLHDAFESQNVDVMKLLIEAGANVNATDGRGLTLVHRALTLENENILEFLVNAGADVDVRDPSGKLLLQKALEIEDIYIFKFLLNAGADINAKDDRGYPLVHYCINYTENLLRLFIKADAVLSVKDPSKKSLLQKTILLQEYKKMKLLINAGVNVNTEDSFGNHLLSIVIETEDLKILKLFIDSGIDVNANYSWQVPIFHDAIKMKDLNILKLLVDAGADVNSKCKIREHNSLHAAARESKNVNVLKTLMGAGAEVNRLTKTEDTAFTIYCSDYGNTNVTKKKNLIKKSLRFLIDYTDVNLIDKEGRNLIAKVIDERDRNVYKVIIEHVAKLNVLKIQVDSSLINIITENTIFNAYFTTCLQELEKAKSTKLLNSWVTVFHLMVENKSKIVKFAGNKDLASDSFNKVKKFPIYGAKAKSNIAKGIIAQAALDEATGTLGYHLPRFGPTHLVIRDILDSLNYGDWKMLCSKKRFREYE